MGSGEGDAPRVIRSLDGWPKCAVSGCYWRVCDPGVSSGARCSEHGGTPAAEMRTDEWGNVETRVERPVVTWEPWD